MTARDRRIIIRWQVNRPGQIKLPGQDNFVPCEIKDINLKGARISLQEKLENGKALKLAIMLENPEQAESKGQSPSKTSGADFARTVPTNIIEVEGWCAWQKSVDGVNIYGIYFSRVSDNAKEAIYKFIYKCCPQEIKQKQWHGTSGGGEDMLNKGFEDRRIFARFPARVAIKYLNLDSNMEGQAETSDISAKGVGFVTNERLHPNTPLEMWLRVPDRGEPLYTRGEVVWSNVGTPNNFRIGVELERADLMGMARVLRTA